MPATEAYQMFAMSAPSHFSDRARCLTPGSRANASRSSPTTSAPPRPATRRRRRRRRAKFASRMSDISILSSSGASGLAQHRIGKRASAPAETIASYGGNRVFGIVEHQQIVFRDQPVAGIARDHIDFAGGGRRIHEVRLHLPLRAEIQAIGVSQARPIPAATRIRNPPPSTSFPHARRDRRSNGSQVLRRVCRGITSA